MELKVVAENSLGIITRAEIDTSIATAKNFPRSIEQFLHNVTAFATRDQATAERMTYSLSRSDKVLEGASVRLAELCCSAYQNIRAGARVISNDGKVIVAQGICVDLENNYTATVEVSRSIINKYGNTLVRICKL